MLKYLLIATALGKASAYWDIVSEQYSWVNIGTSGVNLLNLGVMI
jgi:hypothetical protein